MKEYQKRVIKEQSELKGRIDRLEVFLSSKSDGVDINEKALLAKQLIAMKEYSRILLERIKSF